jgi:hypothetical protein
MEKIQTADPNLQKIQDNVSKALARIERKEWMGGVILRGVELTGGTDTAVDHGLGREPLGWMVVDANAAATYYQGSTTNAHPDRTLFLRASATVTVDLWVL